MLYFLPCFLLYFLPCFLSSFLPFSLILGTTTILSFKLHLLNFQFSVMSMWSSLKPNSERLYTAWGRPILQTRYHMYNLPLHMMDHISLISSSWLWSSTLCFEIVITTDVQVNSIICTLYTTFALLNSGCENFPKSSMLLMGAVVELPYICM